MEQALGPALGPVLVPELRWLALRWLARRWLARRWPVIAPITADSKAMMQPVRSGLKGLGLEGRPTKCRFAPYL